MTTHTMILGGAYRGEGGYKAVCACGYACREKPTAEAAEAAVEAHIRKAAGR